MNIIIKIILICIILLIFVYLISKIFIGTHNIIINKDNLNIQTKINKINKINTKNKAYNIFEKIKANKIIKNMNNNLNKKNIFSIFNKRICLNHDECIKNKVRYCTYGLTNYIHPYYLSNFDKRIFMSKIQMNFTKQDYINWLNCYKNDKSKIKNLSYTNHKNLKKLINKDTDFKIPSSKIKKQKFINLYVNN